MIRLGCLLALVLAIAVPAIASRYLPFWGTMLVVLAEGFLLVLIGPKLFGWAIKRFIMGMFRTKSRVLQGARVHIHEVRAVEKPQEREQFVEEARALPGEGEPEEADQDQDEDEEDEEDEEEADGDHHHVFVDVTITPVGGTSKMSHWDPTELLLVPYDARISMDDGEDATDALSGSVDTIHLIDESGNKIEDFDKLVGPARLQIVFACPMTLHGRAKLRYYFEGIGDLHVP